MYRYDDTIGRRRFLGLGAATAAGAVSAASLTGCATFGSTPRALVADGDAERRFGREAGDWIPSCCNMCGGQSGILVHVVDGVVQKIEPNHWNPNNYTNISTDFFDGYTEEFGCKEGGAICPRGNAGIQQLYDPDRIQRPLKRTNRDRSPGTDPGWQEITWDQAITEIAGKMRTLRDAGEAHKLLWYSEDSSFVNIQDDFCKLFGTPNYSNHSNLCDTARKAAFKVVLGDERPLADMLQSKYILLFGWNPASAIKWVYLPRILTRAIERGARLVVVDPYLSDTAAKAHEWVAIRPGTDGAMALAMGHVILRDKLYDADFVASWTVGFDEYAAYVADKTPEWAERITSVPASVIERIAREFATTKPAVVDAWSGPGQQSNGVQGGRAIAILAALVGGIDRPGTLMNPSKKGNKHLDVHADAVAKESLKQPRFDELEKYPLGHKSGVYARSFTNLADDKGPYTPKMAMIVFQNLMMSLPGSATVARALAKLEMVVVIDTMMSETALLADYVLPGTVYLERYDLNSHWVTWGALGLRQPVVKPRFGQPAEYETVTLLGRALDLRTEEGEAFFLHGHISGADVQDTTRWYEEMLSAELKAGDPKITLEELKALPGAVWVDKKGTQYEKYASEIPAEKLEGAFYDGDPAADGTAVFDKPKDQKGKRIGTVFGGRVLKGFQTPSGKVELVAAWLGAKTDANGLAVSALPVYTPRDWQPDEKYPLYQINWKEASHTHSRTQNNSWLLELKDRSPLIVHPETARRFGLTNGGKAWVTSPYGEVLAEVKVSLRIHPEVVGLQHGFGHTALGRLARGRGTSDATLRPTKADPLGGQAMHKESCVTLKPA